MVKIKGLSKKLSTLNSQLSTPKGFTLIELMVVLSVTAVLGTLGIAGFTVFNQTQLLSGAALDVIVILDLAKSRAQSQIKPSSCSSSETLDGYKVKILTPKNYTLYVRCGGVDKKINEEAKLLPSNLNFQGEISFFFPIQTGGVEAPGEIVISGYGRTKTISVNSFGGVSVQ